MPEPPSRLPFLLREEAAYVVPDELDLWPAIRAEALTRQYAPQEIPVPRHQTLLHNRAADPGRTRLVGLVAALLLAGSGLAGYLRLSNPLPASAQVVLRYAAAVRLAPRQVLHVRYLLTVTGMQKGSRATAGLRGVADVWLTADARGAPTVSVQTLTMSHMNMISRYVQVGQQVYAYNPEMRGDHVIVLNPAQRALPSWVEPSATYLGSSVAQDLTVLTQRFPQRLRMLEHQTLNGHAVDTLTVDGWSSRPGQRTTFYFDAQTYILRGFDATSLDPTYPMPSWQARLVSSTVIPSTAVAPRTFRLNAPASAQVAPFDLTDPAAFQAIARAFTSACHSVTSMKTALMTRDNLLVTCQATAPSMTAAALLAALAAPAATALDGAVAAGQITQAQTLAARGALHDQLITWIARPPAQSHLPPGAASTPAASPTGNS